MFVIVKDNKENEGAYSVTNSGGEDVMYIFEQEDDALRYAMMLEEDGFPETDIVMVDDDTMIKACEYSSTRYAIITSNDIVIPPKHDYI
jgi:hypothetical protein